MCTTAEGTLVAAVDGLGHGEEAAAAAEAGIRALRENSSEHVISLVRHCHQALRRTRGVVMSLASFHVRQGFMTWIGVGNVAGVLLRRDRQLAPDNLLLRGGVVGDQLPSLQAAVLPVAQGDTLILATDGVRDDFAAEANLLDPPQRLAERVLARSAKGTDDALVLVARFVGAGHE